MQKNQAKYKHLFFDLDRTLYDFDQNNLLTFNELFSEFDLTNRGIQDFETFFAYYSRINLALWDDYKNLRICKDDLNFRRFYESLQYFGLDDKTLSKEIGSFYLKSSTTKTILFPYTLETLEQLHQKYQMHIITNGFEEIQFIKITNSGLAKYFDKIITSERAGYKKPDQRIFEYALTEANALACESLIIGDDPEADILGGHRAGIDQLWVKHIAQQPLVKATYEVDTLREILEFL
jgi:putative hydrolase of the HAD superfamily